MDLIFDLIDEYRKKKQGDKGPKLTTFLTMLTERQIRMLNTMGMRYVRSEALKTAYDVVHEDRVKKYGPGVEIPFNRDEMPTFKYDAAAFLVGKLQADADEKALEAAVAGLRGNPAGRIELARWDDRVIAEIKKEFLIVDPSKTREALKIGSLDDLAGDGSQERIGELEKENERLRALIARGAPARPATERPQTFCTSCDNWGYHSTAQCDPSRTRRR